MDLVERMQGMQGSLLRSVHLEGSSNTVVAAYCAVVLLLLSAIVTLLLPGGGKRKTLPPVVPGIPLIGGFLKFIRGPIYLMRDALVKYPGGVYTVKVFHRPITFLIGPEVSAHFFTAKDTELSQKEVYEFNVPTFGKGVVFDVDHVVRMEQFRFFADALKTAKLKTYVDVMVREAEAFFDKWGNEGVVDLRDSLADLIILTAASALMGKEIRENLFEKVSTLIHDLDMGMLPISVMFPYLPIPAHWKRDKARAELSRIFSKVITERRANNVQAVDVLQAFMDARYKNGKGLSDDEITGMLIAVLFGGQHTSSITSTWTGLLLHNHPEALAAALDEQRASIRKHGQRLDFDVVGEMDVLHRSVKEALRMFPPLIMLMRYTHEDFTVTTRQGQTYDIPKGHVLVTSPATSHRLPNVFPHPEKFDPDRFGPGREEDKKQPFSFIGFGGGRHGCMGETFGYMQVKVIWSVLLRKYDISLCQQLNEPDYEGMVVGPKGACNVRYKRRSTPLA